MRARLLGRLNARRGDAGFTLVELLVAMTLMAVISTITVTALVSVFRGETRVDNDSRGLNDVQIVAERMSRDLQQARAVYTGANSDHLKIWIDKNSDYVSTPDELITWSLVADATDPNHFDVKRSADNGTSTIIGHTLVAKFAFTYICPTGANPRAVCAAGSEPSASSVDVDMQYDANIGHTTHPGTPTPTTHHVDFTVMLRNAG